MRLAGTAPRWFLWLLAAAVLAGDQATKRWALAVLRHDDSVPVLGDLVRFTYTRNPGVAFGLFADGAVPLGWLSLVALVVVLWLAFRPSAARWPRAAALGLILGGALGNLVDRVRWGSVVDFIDVGVGERFRWWVFNVADAAITIGVILWAWQLLLGRPSASPSIPAAGTAPGGGDASRGP